jgi:hypothetical protein
MIVVTVLNDGSSSQSATTSLLRAAGEATKSTAMIGFPNW